MNTEGTGAAFRERSNLFCLITSLVIYPALLIGSLLWPRPGMLVAMVILGVVLQVAALIVLHIVASISTKREPDDERVRQIERRGGRVSGIILSVGIWAGIALAVLQGFQEPARELSLSNPMLIGYVLFAVFIISEIARMGSVAFGYRRL